MAPAVKTSKSPDSKAAETKKALKANAKAAVEGKPKKDMKVDVKEEDEKKKKNMAGDVKEAAENALSRPKRKAVDSVSSYKEKTVRLSDKDSKIQVKAEQDEATEESALVTTMGTLPTKGDELPRRRMVDLIVYDGEGKAQPIELLDTGYEDGLWARGYMLPVNGPTDKKSGVLCEIGPIEDWLIDDYDSPEPDGVKVILVTPMAEYSVVGVNRAYKKLMDPVLDGAAAFRHCYRALAKHLGGNPAMSLDDLLVRLARGPPAPSGGKFTREAVLRSGRFVLKQMRQVDATAAATDGDDDDGDGDRQNMSSLPALVALSAEVEAFEAAAVAFERVPGALTIRDGANSNRGGASAANGGPGGSSSGAGGSSKGKGTDDGLDEDARLALKLQKEEDALAGITARGRGGRGGNGAGGRGARGGASGGATASPGSLRGGPYIKIAEAEIADDYPEPAFYSKTEEEADEYLFYADDAEAIPVEDLPRRRLTNFAFYNSEGRLVPLELLPMWGGVDPDVDMFGSGDMVEEDPESEWTGGEDAALPSSDTSGALDGSNAAGAGSSGGSGSEVASGSGAGASGSGSASGLGASGSGGSGSGGAGSGSNAGASGSGGSGSGSSAGASGSGGSSSASGMDASGGGAAPTGIRIFLSEIKEWVVEYGAGMLFVSVRTDGAWYRLGQPAPQYGPWYTPVIRAARLAVAAITMLASEPRAARLSFNDIARRMADKGLFGSAAGSATATLPAPGPTSEDATAGDGDGGDDSEPAGAPMDTDASATGADVSGKDGADVIMADAAADGKGSGGAKGGAVKGAKKGAAVASASARLARQVAEAERFLVVHGQIVSNLFRDYPNTTIQRCGFLSQLAERMAARRHTRLDLKKADARGLLARRTRGRNLNPTAGARPDVTKRKAMRATMTKLVYRVFKGAFVGDAEEGEEGQARDKPGVPVPLVADAGNEGEELKEEENEDEDEEGGRGKGASGRKNKSGKDTVAAKEGGKKGGKKAKPVAAGEKAGWVGDSVGAMRGGQVRLYATARASDGVEFGVGDVVAVRALPGGSLAGADASMSNSEDDENNAAARPQLVLVRYLSEQTGVADGSHNKGDDGEGVVVVTSAADASNSSSGSGAGAGDATSFRFEGKEYHTDQYVYVWPEFVPPEVNPGGGKKSETATPAAAPDASFKAGKNIGSRPFVVGQIVSFESSKVRGGKGGSGGASAGAGARVLATVEQVTLRRFYRNEDIGGSERAYKGDIQELYYSDQTVTVPLDALAPGSPIVCCHRELFDIAAFRAQPHAFVCNLAFDPATKAIKKLHLDKLNTAKSAAGAATAGAGKGKGKAPAVDVAGAGKGKGKMVAEPAELDGSYGGAGSDHDAGKLRTMDIFAGCGGLSEGFHQSGVTVTRWAIEYDQPASEAFSLNNPRAAVFCENCNVVLRGVMEKSGQLDECVSTPEADEGAAKLTAETLARLPRPGEVDFITGGPPCQGFSGMNRFNKGQWSRIQCEMILAFLSFADVYRPRFFLLENVRNFVTFNKGLTFRLALASLLEIGYQLRVGVLQAGYYGVAQSRKRAFIIAAAPGETLPDWPEPMHVFHSPQMGVPLPGGDSYRAVPESKDGAPLRTTTVRDVIGDLPPVGNGAAEPVLKYAVPPVSWFQKMIRGHRDEGADGGAKGVDGGIAPSEELRDHISKEMNELNVLRCKHIPKRAGADWRDLPDIKVKLSNGKEEALIPWCLPNTAARHNQWKGLFGRLAWEGNFPTAITDPQPMGKVGMCFHPEQDRIVTVRECARAQGFPDVYRFAGNIQAMHRQIGNAVPPPLALALGRKLKEALSGGSGDSSK
eukprot:jgi/Mesvir1/7057/Mv09173-RA.1